MYKRLGPLHLPLISIKLEVHKTYHTYIQRA